MQLKYCFKKEKMQFLRTHCFTVIALVIFGFAIGNPLMFKFCDVVLSSMDYPDFSDASTVQPNDNNNSASDNSNIPSNLFGGITAAVNFEGTDIGSHNVNSAVPDNTQSNTQTADSTASISSIFGEIGMDDILAVYSDAGMMFATSISTFTGSALLVIMLMLMSAAGGEQKKRAMIVPMASGLQYKNYLVPKFVIYPITIMLLTMAASMVAGSLCNMMFPNNKISFGIMLLSSLLCGIYMGFVVSVYLSVGLITSRPGVTTAMIYVSQTMIHTLLNVIGLRDYQPFALLNYISGEMVTEDFSFSEEAPAIIVSAVIAIVIAVLMYFLALGVLGSKKIDNKAEQEPEF